MIRSMTGFARGEVTTPQGQLLCEIRSINNRYLEVQIKLPETFRPIEAELRQLAMGQLGRGRVDAALSLRGLEARLPSGHLNLPLARQLIAHAEAVAHEMRTPGPLSPMEVMRWPGVLEQEELDPAVLFPAALSLFGQTISDLAAARGREGTRVEEMLERRCTEIEARVAAVVTRLPTVHERIRERLRERIESLAIAVDHDRMEQELALLAQKLDVSEELDRLTAHLAEFRDTLRVETPVGRRLDFLVQELNREANTLASKSADAETTRHAVDIKVLVEQIREQVQNIE